MRVPLVRAVLLVSSMLLVSCTAAPTSPGDALLVTAAISPASVRASDTVTVRVVVTNRGSEPWEINTKTCPGPFVVTDQSGAAVAPGVRVCTADLPMKELAPGDEYVFTLRWAAVLEAGTYALRGRVPARGGLVESEPVTLTVTP